VTRQRHDDLGGQVVPGRRAVLELLRAGHRRVRSISLSAGRDPAPIGRYVEERLPPLMQAGWLSEAEAVLDEALRRLAAPPAAPGAGK